MGGPIENTAAVPASTLEAAEALAGLLTGTEELQNFVRLARAVRLDSQVSEILGLINEYQAGNAPQDVSMDALEEHMERQPIVQEYRQAERQVRAVFAAVEEAISGQARLPFAEFARPSGCS